MSRLLVCRVTLSCLALLRVHLQQHGSAGVLLGFCLSFEQSFPKE